MALSVQAVFFPGVIFHELSHLIACWCFGVKVRKIKLFGTKEAFVEHDKPNAWQSLGITIAPFILGNIFSFALFFSAKDLFVGASGMAIVFCWFGFSLALFSFPSEQDAMNAFGSFTGFYKNALFGKKSVLPKLLWLLLLPFIFVPLFLLLGFFLVFDRFLALRVVWMVAVFFFSFNATTFFDIAAMLDSALKSAFSLFFG